MTKAEQQIARVVIALWPACNAHDGYVGCGELAQYRSSYDYEMCRCPKHRTGLTVAYELDGYDEAVALAVAVRAAAGGT